MRALNKQVFEFNQTKLSELEGAEVVYSCQDDVAPGVTHAARRAYARRCLCDIASDAVSLKPGAIVLSTREVDGVATATQGVVRESGATSAVVDFNGRTVAVTFMAMTIHRAQGASLATLAIDFSELNWRLCGLVYSGISRCRSLEGLLVRGLRREHIVVDTEAMKFYTD